MASIFVHGSPGSYKSASTLWYELLPALREGRLVITNIEGLKPLETIEAILCEKFPSTAKLWRVSTQNPTGLALMRRFWCWAPVGAFILIDEVQGVYPSSKADKTFKIEQLNKVPAVDMVGLPSAFLDEFNARLDDVSPDTLGEGDVDDLGITVFDDNGHIIYPADISDAFNRHRKYNWDLVYCTPDIDEVHPLVRGVAETAYAYKHNDALGKLIPYYKRRPRIYPHKPRESGTYVPAKASIFTRKVPTQVFALYKSTSTGAITGQTKGSTPFSDVRFIGVLLILLAVIIYYIWFFGIYEAPTLDVDQSSQSGEVVKQVVDTSLAAFINPEGNQNAVRVVNAVDAVLPYGSHEIYVTGVIANLNKYRFITGRDYIFELRSSRGVFAISSDLMRDMGWEFEYRHDCHVIASNGSSSVNAFCMPNEARDFVPDSVASNQPTVSLF
ncbi:zonular occludens toxin domain-containing protein [Shewanella sp.]|uniref:zonular occludens toxin domain-containing protein n=1 Tax=Shewanella sp. TaxID=50422 RepID=UPI003563E97D